MLVSEVWFKLFQEDVCQSNCPLHPDMNPVIRIASTVITGQPAVDFFEGHHPDLQPFGVDNAGNQAEWLVNITTKVDAVCNANIWG